jgi:hypothetical protein
VISCEGNCIHVDKLVRISLQEPNKFDAAVIEGIATAGIQDAECFRDSHCNEADGSIILCHQLFVFMVH